MTTAVATREELRDTAIRTLVTHYKRERAGMATPADLVATVTPAIQAAHEAGWSSDDIHPAADRRYAHWLIAGADRTEQCADISSFIELIARHRGLIGRVLGRDIPASTSPIVFTQHVQDAARALADTPAWVYDREMLDVAAVEYLGAALEAEGDAVVGHLRAADDALALVDITGWR